MLLIVQIVVFVIQVQAFVAGAAHAWGFGTLAALVAAVLISIIPGIGGFILAVMTFYGAYAAWDWSWWQALILASPGIALSVFALAGSAILALFSSPDRRRS